MDTKSNYVAKTSGEVAPHHKLKALTIGGTCLTATTLILVVISLCFGGSFAPFIILLMSSRIGASVYLLTKAPSKKEVGLLLFWLALMAKSVISYAQFLTAMP